MKKKQNTVTFFKQKSYMLAAGLMVAATLGMTGVYFSEQNKGKEQQEQLAKLEQEQQEAVEEAEKLAAVDQVIPPENEDFLDDPEVISSKDESETEAMEEEIVEDTQETTSTEVQKELHFDVETEMGWPLLGNVIMNYSMEQTVYFATLDQYKYNPAIVIQGNVNDKVISVADGTVTAVETNEVTGCTVTVDMGDGYSTVYGQLKEVPVSVGEYIAEGEIVGYVSEPTKYYSVEGPNLYFQLLKDNESIDPMEFLQ